MNNNNLYKSTHEDCIRNYGDLDASTKELIECAIAGQQLAYCPYSNFQVGAAFRTACGRLFNGCNVEISTFTPTSCAERTALAKAVSEGYTKFTAGAVVAFQEDSFTTPCGVCRQFIFTFADEDIPLYFTKSKAGTKKSDADHVLVTSINNLFPYGSRTYKTK